MDRPARVGVIDGVADVEEAAEQLALLEIAAAAGPPTLTPPSHSDFSGWVYLTSSEAKIEFKPVEPRNPWIDAFSSELGRQVLVVLS